MSVEIDPSLVAAKILELVQAQGATAEELEEFSQNLIVREEGPNRLTVVWYETTREQRNGILAQEAAAFTKDGAVVRVGEVVCGHGFAGPIAEILPLARVRVGPRVCPVSDVWSTGGFAPEARIVVGTADDGGRPIDATEQTVEQAAEVLAKAAGDPMAGSPKGPVFR